MTTPSNPPPLNHEHLRRQLAGIMEVMRRNGFYFKPKEQGQQ